MKVKRKWLIFQHQNRTAVPQVRCCHCFTDTELITVWVYISLFTTSVAPARQTVGHSEHDTATFLAASCYLRVTRLQCDLDAHTREQHLQP